MKNITLYKALIIAISWLQLVIYFPLFLSANPLSCEKLFNTSLNTSYNNLLTNNDFYLKRDIDSVSTFITYKKGDRNRSFFDDIMELESNDHFMDSGAGAGYVLLDLYMSYSQRYISHLGNKYPLRKHNPPFSTAISFVKPIEWHTYSVPGIGKYINKVRYLDGRFVEDIPHEEIVKFGKLKLILDSVGPLAYSDRVDLVLQKYIDLLSYDGGIDIYFGKVTPRESKPPEIYSGRGESYETEIILKNGTRVNFTDWLKLIPGLTIYHSSSFGVRIEKNIEDVQIPKLKLITYIDNILPPFRIFQEID